jgi:hypothetical protein
MQARRKGISISVSGRLGGAEIARQEKSDHGSVPLTTLQANVDYGYCHRVHDLRHDRREESGSTAGMYGEPTETPTSARRRARRDVGSGRRSESLNVISTHDPRTSDTGV